MLNFITKTVPVPKYIPGIRLSAKVVWKRGKYYAVMRNKDHLEIADTDSLKGCKWIYALPTNTFHNVWYKKLYDKNTTPGAIPMFLRYWGKYFHGMTIYGKVIDGIFHEIRRKDNESDIPTSTSG